MCQSTRRRSRDSNFQSRSTEKTHQRQADGATLWMRQGRGELRHARGCWLGQAAEAEGDGCRG